MKLHGRDNELAQIREACLHAREGRGRVIVVSGEAGLGKSALLEVIATELAPMFDVTWGRAWELADAPAYFPLWPCLKSLGIDPVAPAHGDASQTFELWERVLEALVAASGRRPVLWVIEDLHVADAQTLDLLSFLAQAIRPLRVVLLVTMRPRDPRLDDRTEKRLVRIARDGREIRLAPLDTATVSALATQWLGRPLQAAELAQLAERTGGNPLFVIECARAGRGHGKQLVDAVPPTVAVVVGERVELLPEATRATLGDAAVLGNEMTAATLAAMADQLPARVIDDLAAALRVGILDELGPGRFRFSHALVRDAIEAAMPAAARSDAHARAERALATVPDAPQIAIERARHALASLAAGREQLTIERVNHAIAVLENQGTYDRASMLCKQLHELRSAGLLSAATSSELLHAARISLAAGKFAESRLLCLGGAALARAAGDVPAFATAVLALGAELHPAQIDTALVAHLEEALALIGNERSPLRCRVAVRLAAALQPAPDPEIPIAMARTAIAEARAAGDPALLADVLFVAISALTEFVDAEELRGLNLEHLELLRETDDVAQTLRAYTRLIFAEGELGDFMSLDAHLDEMLVLANSVGHPRLTWRALLLGSMRAVARGQFSDSERYIAEVERATQLTDDPSLPISFEAHRHYRAVDLHRETTVNHGLAQIETSLASLPNGRNIVPLVRGTVAARFGDVAGVARALTGFPIEQALGRRKTTSLTAVLGELVAAAGTPEQRALFVERLTPLVDRHVYFGQAPMSYGGPVRRILGLLELSLGNRTAGELHLRRALETCRALGFATWVARISFEVGDHEEAARLAANLGIRGLARRANVPPAGSTKSQLEAAAPATRPSLGFSRDGDVWRISYGVRVARVADSRGMELIAKLVERPGEDVHVLVLAGTGGEALTDSDAGNALDDRAARTYRERLAALADELDRAEANCDRGRIEKLTHEREALTGELARAFGLGNNLRKVGSVSERARVNVQRRIKDSLARIGQHDSVIADYLRSAIRTGTYCTFRA